MGAVQYPGFVAVSWRPFNVVTLFCKSSEYPFPSWRQQFVCAFLALQPLKVVASSLRPPDVYNCAVPANIFPCCVILTNTYLCCTILMIPICTHNVIPSLRSKTSRHHHIIPAVPRPQALSRCPDGHRGALCRHSSIGSWDVVARSPLPPNVAAKLDWQSIADWAYAGFFAVEVQFHIRDQFGFLSPNYTGRVFWIFFEKSRNKLVWPFLMFLVVLA